MDDFYVCDLLFKQREKPKNFYSCKAVNVYDNKYRINVYTETYDPIHNLDKTKIAESYWTELRKDKLIILRKEGMEQEKV